MRNAAIKAWLSKAEDPRRSGNWEYTELCLIWSGLEIARWDAGQPILKKILTPFPKHIQQAVTDIREALELGRSCVQEERFPVGNVSLWTVSSRGKALLGLPHKQDERRFSDEDDEAT